MRLRARHVLTVSGPPIADGSVAVEGGRIVDVGPAAAIAARRPDLPERDLGATVIAPGFVDAHCHVEWSAARAVPRGGSFADWLHEMMAAGRAMAPDDFAAAARRGARMALERGTTTLVDSGPTGAGAEALRSLGLRGIVHLEAFGRLEGAAADAAADELARRIAVLDGGPLVRIGVAPHAPYTVSPGLWTALARHTDLRDRPWTTHVAESAEELPAISGCGGPLRDLFASRDSVPGHWPGEGSVVARLAAAGALRPGLVCAHCVQLAYDDPAHLSTAGVGVAHCPVSNVSLAVGRMDVDALLAAGVAVGLGTDSPATSGRYAVPDDAALLVAAGRDPHEVLGLMTLGGARAAGIDDLVGSIEPGKRADLVAFPYRGGSDPVGSVLGPDVLPSLVMVDGVARVDHTA